LVRRLRLILLVVMFMLLLTDHLRFGWLGSRFVPRVPWLEWLGIALTAAGFALCVWARIHLGQYWSDKIGLKADHRLIRSGPYATLRHPIYSGVLLAITGSTLAIGEWRCVVVFAVMLVNYCIKAAREDRLLAAAFGDAFREHARQAGFLLPRL